MIGRLRAGWWALIVSLVSLVYLALAVVVPGVAEALMIAFVAALLAPVVYVEARERNDG